ncbi:hypothetical protein ALC53_13519 [Atta colombica]|uniref:Uncharacterized protein n=1 Tax=Atta colombica TaxID=520822 RepID=A0A195AVN7_9HYME|nr:hypothetical protein ALC53_13519 [Atta colombica]
MIDADKFPSLSHLLVLPSLFLVVLSLFLSFSINQGGEGLSLFYDFSRLRCPSLSRHSVLRLSEERRKNSSGRWPPPASHRFIPLSHGALFYDGDHREPPGETAGSPRSRCTGSLTATLTDGGGEGLENRETGTRSHDDHTTTTTTIMTTTTTDTTQ